ncbi:MAG: hypothetical protein ACQESK_03540 [Bacteroidota bacterium]
MTNQLLAGVFGLALMGGVMLSSQEAEAQGGSLPPVIVDPNPGGGDSDCEQGSPIWITEWSDKYNSTTCRPGGDCCCAQFN